MNDIEPMAVVENRILSNMSNKAAKEKKESSILSKWATLDDNQYFAVPKVTEELPSAVYNIINAKDIEFLKCNSFSSDGLIKFNDSAVDEVVNDIRKFWTLENDFKHFGLRFKRGILLYGPPGGGKSCIIKLAIKDVLKQSGVAFIFDEPFLCEHGIKKFRQVQPDTPIIVVMEDLDTIIGTYPKTNVLNLLDGVSDFDKVCFIATTNYPEQLEDRIKNRPSRFDKRYEIGLPKESIRKQYIEFLFSKMDSNVPYNLEQWIEDTKNMSVAHIKELFISVHLYKNDYNATIDTLKNMKKNIKSDNERKAGFTN